MIFGRYHFQKEKQMKLKFAWLLVVFGTFFPTSLFSNTIYFPQVAYGGGYSTTFVVVNTGTTSVTARLNFYSQDGPPRADLNKQADIAAGESARFTIPDNGALTVVWAELVADNGTVQGVATFDLRNNGVLVTSAGVLGVEGNNRFLLPVDVTPLERTGLALRQCSFVKRKCLASADRRERNCSAHRAAHSVYAAEITVRGLRPGTVSPNWKRTSGERWSSKLTPAHPVARWPQPR
jgi:hypothetical protein